MSCVTFLSPIFPFSLPFRLVTVRLDCNSFDLHIILVLQDKIIELDIKLIKSQIYNLIKSQMTTLIDSTKKMFNSISLLTEKMENQSENLNDIWAASSEFVSYRLCEQRRFRRACASAQSRQNLRCSLIQAASQEEPSDRKPDPWPF